MTSGAFASECTTMSTGLVAEVTRQPRREPLDRKVAELAVPFVLEDVRGRLRERREGGVERIDLLELEESPVRELA